MMLGCSPALHLVHLVAYNWVRLCPRPHAWYLDELIQLLRFMARLGILQQKRSECDISS